jgi:hypothetical protein
VKKYIVVLYFLLIGGVFAFAQQQRANTLDAAISTAQKQIEAKLAYDTKVVVYDFRVVLQVQDQRRPTNQLSDYVLEQLVAALTKGEKLIVPSRSEVIQQARQREINFQTSGEVSDDEISAIGKAFGASIVISGTLRAFSGYYEFNLMVTEIETLRNIIPIQIRLNKNDKQTKDLLGITGEEEDQARIAREKKRQEWLNDQSNRTSRFVIGAQAGVSMMFSNHEGDKLYLDDSNLTYEDKGTTGFTGQFNLGLNQVGKKMLGFRLNGVFSLNEGVTTTVTNKTTAKSDPVLEFSYSTFDLGLLVEIAPATEMILFTLYAGPYISIPVSDLKLKIGDKEISNAKLEPFAGPIANIGAVAGLNFGYKLGFTGYIVLDARYKYDILPTKFSALGTDAYKDPIEFYHRHGLQLTLGYEFWI